MARAKDAPFYAVAAARKKKRKAEACRRCAWKMRSSTLFVIVHPLAQLLACLEVRHVLARDLHLLSGLRIAAGSGRTVVQAEAAEAADLDAVAGRERLRHRVQHR